MERGSDKHAPRLDENLKVDTRSLVQGAPVESRADEAREQEGPGDDDPVPDARLSGERGLDVDDRMLTYEEIEARSELARHLETSVFPADRELLLESARRTQAPPRVLDQLSRLPEDTTFTHTQAVWEALGGRSEPGRA